MKVNVYQTVEITDEQRRQIASVLDGAVTKRPATRDEMKEYVWTYGATWKESLFEEYDQIVNGPLKGSSAEEVATPVEEVSDDEIDEDDLL